MSFKTGIFPQTCKMANIIPIYEKGDKLDCWNYRPISLLSNIGKVIEQCMHGRLCKFLNKINRLYAKPFGFWNTHSTNHALISITKEIRRALDKDEFACGVFLDFQKAVDTINHKMLPTKLEYHGIRTLESDYFKSHLANRLQQKYSRNNISPTRNNLWSTTRLSPWAIAFSNIYKWPQWSYRTLDYSPLCRWHKYTL